MSYSIYMEKQNEDLTPQQRLEDYINIYMDSKTNQDEFEVRFGTKYYNKISKIDFENIIAKVKSMGFHATNIDGDAYLNIQNEYADARSGRMKLSNIRTTIFGIHNIQKYCKENNIDPENIPYGTEFYKNSVNV